MTTGKALLIGVLILLAGCAPSFEVANFGGGALPPKPLRSITDIVDHKNTAALLTMQRYPWEKPAQAWIVNLKGKTTFTPLNQDPGDSPLLGPLEGFAGRVQPTLPVTPAP